MSKNVVVAAFVLSFVTCLPAKADIITVTETGTAIATPGFGNSEWGLQTTLEGVVISQQNYTATWTFDTSLAITQDYTAQYSNVYGNFCQQCSGGPGITASLTILGFTRTINDADYFSQIGMNSNQFIADIRHSPTTFLITDVLDFVFPFVSGGFTSFSVDIDGSDPSHTSRFQFGNNSSGPRGTLYPDHITLTNEYVGVAAVPGPIVGAGIPGLIALFSLGGYYWRRKQLAG